MDFKDFFAYVLPIYQPYGLTKVMYQALPEMEDAISVRSNVPYLNPQG